jgi:formylglycine-generating enzyme required for sulfatase activity
MSGRFASPAFLQHNLLVNSDSLSIKEETFQKFPPTPFFRGEVCPQDSIDTLLSHFNKKELLMKNTIKLIGAIAFILALVFTVSCGDGGGGTKGKDPDGDIDIEMVKISAGTFQMGSPLTEPYRHTDEVQHSVTLSAFSMSKYLVTQEQYQAVMGSNPSYFKAAVSGESGTPEKLPVEWVSWYDAIVFCNKLSIAQKLTPAYSISGSTNPSEWGAVPASANAAWNAVTVVAGSNGYRLPTEAQWEYACRAGTTTAYNTGAAVSDNTGWYNVNSGSKTHKVGLKPANAFGLYDMHGNVWEWCWDWYGAYDPGAQTNPQGAVSGANRVGRGGGWSNSAESIRSAYRASGPSYWYINYGFRLVRPN